MMTKTKSARCWGDIFKKLLLSLTIGYINKVLVVVVVVVVVVSVDGIEGINGNDNNPCGLYLDRSSIPGAGWGVFAGKNYRRGDIISSPSIGIQVVDPLPILTATHPIDTLITQFSWDPIWVGGDMEADAVFTLLPGLGMLLNFHPVLHNVIPTSLWEDPIILSRASGATTTTTTTAATSPMAGSFTAYHNVTYIATTDIQIGQELFGSVSDEWLSTSATQLPLERDFQRADQIIQNLHQFLFPSSNNKNKSSSFTEATALDIIHRIKTEMNVGNNQKPFDLIPDSLDKFHDAYERGTARSSLVEQDFPKLQRTGKCLDNIRPDISTIPGAGRGAFATRFIPKGSLVSPAPLVHVRNSNLLDIPTTEERAINSQQLLLNYCFGHPKSTILLCPTTSVALINHSSKDPNVEIRWARTEENGQTKYHNSKVEHLFNISDGGGNTKLMFDFVALRDINPDEEIFLHYGEEWEKTFQKHISEWRQTYESTTIEENDSRRVGLQNDDDMQIVPSKPNQNHTYLCRLEPFAREDAVDGRDIPIEDYYANPSVDPSNWSDQIKFIYGENQYAFWWPCDVVSSSGGSKPVFTVNVFKRIADSNGERSMIKRVKNVPRSSIRPISRPYHSSQHLPNAFRHYIAIPDSIFPSPWRVDYVSSESLNLGIKDPGIQDLGPEAYDRHIKTVEEAECGLYVAPSTIPGAGNGVYLGVDIPGSGVEIGPLVPAIPVIDLLSDSWDANDYVWEANSISCNYEGRVIHVLAVNEGALCNFHPGLVNAAMKESPYSPTLGQHDPGAGAFSYYSANGFVSLHTLKAGDEIFISYGEGWFKNRENIGLVPLSENYREANKVVASLAALLSDPGNSMQDDQMEDLIALVHDNVISNPATQLVLSKVTTVEDIAKVFIFNGTAETLTKRRSLEWLSENGEILEPPYSSLAISIISVKARSLSSRFCRFFLQGKCLDHIYTKTSDIPSAGIGAFVRRLIRKGSVIIASPLLVTYGADAFKVQLQEELTSEINPLQLFYNYQFFHPNSSAYFFPINTAIAINHQSTRYFDRYNPLSPNAEIRWSSSERKSSYYLQRHLNDLKREVYATVVLEFVATRDIQKDEEVFIDYGEEWEMEWNSHVQRVATSKKSWFHRSTKQDEVSKYSSSKIVHQMNEDKFNIDYHAWSQYHCSVCHHSQIPTDEGSKIIISSSSSFRGIEVDDEGFILYLTYAADGHNYWLPCKILRADKSDSIFDVVYFQTNQEGSNYSSILRRRADLDMRFLRFITKPYKGDNQKKSAFRHPIKIPDSIFPPLWMDLS